MTNLNQRYPELDCIRGLAVLGMIAYHLGFDLSHYYGFGFDVTTGMFAAFARFTASVFLMLIGICFVISWERTAPGFRRWKYGKRALVILASGMIVTIITWIIDPSTFVVFGILHLIAIATVIQSVIRPLRTWNLLLGTLLFLTAFVLPTGAITTPLLLPFGIMNKGFISVDYYPLLPWLGPVLIGMGLGDVLYIPQRQAFLLIFNRIQWPKWLLWTGRKSLPIYFIHQPLILLILWMVLGRYTQLI